MSRDTIARKLPEKVKRRVLDLIAQGVKYKDIERETGVIPQVISSVKSQAAAPVPSMIPGLSKHAGKLVGEELGAKVKPGQYEPMSAMGRPGPLTGAPTLVSSPNTVSGQAPGRVRLSASAKLRKLLRKELPVTERVELLASLARNEDSRIAIRAFQILSELEAEGEALNEDRAPAPLFVLPKGSLVGVQPVTQPSREPESESESD